MGTNKKIICIVVGVVVCLLLIASVCLTFFKKDNEDVIRMAIGGGNTTYFVLKSNGQIQVEVGLCRNDELTFDLTKEMKFDRATKLGVKYIYAEYMPSPTEIIIDEFVRLAEETFSYATNDYTESTDVEPVTLWYNGKQIQRSSHASLPTDMKKLLDRFMELSPIPVYLPAGA